MIIKLLPFHSLSGTVSEAVKNSGPHRPDILDVSDVLLTYLKSLTGHCCLDE